MREGSSFYGYVCFSLGCVLGKCPYMLHGAVHIDRLGLYFQRLFPIRFALWMTGFLSCRFFAIKIQFLELEVLIGMYHTGFAVNISLYINHIVITCYCVFYCVFPNYFMIICKEEIEYVVIPSGLFNNLCAE